MSADQGLLQAILDDPDDDTSRLVYADWLDEHGTSAADRARAEFIRLQCAIERLEKWSPERLDMEERAEPLLAQYAEDWQADVPEWARYSADVPLDGSCFRRGFLDRVSGTPEDFIESAGELFAVAPVREARVSLVRDGGRALAACPDLARLRHLELACTDAQLDLPGFLASPYVEGLTGLALDYLAPHPSGGFLNHTPMLGDAEAAALANCPRLSRLKSLDLSTNNIGPDGVSALLYSPHLARLEELDLRGNPLSNPGLRRLAESPRAGQLTRLELIGTEFGNAGMRALASGRPARLRKLSLGGLGCRIGWAGWDALARCEHLTGLRELDLFYCPLNRARVRAIARSPHLAGLRSLELSGTKFDSDMARELADSPSLRSLRFLDLQHNRVGAEGAAALAASPVLASVTGVVLYDNAVGDDGAAALAASEHLTELRRLCLTSTGLGPAGARALASSSHLPQLRDLDLQSNPLGDEGGKALCESPYLGRLRRLALYDCGIGAEVTNALRERFGEVLAI